MPGDIATSQIEFPIYDARDDMIAAMGISCPSVRVDAAHPAELGHIVLRESGG
ncbi:hypothetical protein [Paraburkholderia sp. MM6662-R1]|uniref:hypothetical protein n=1 Tax=Paraburkholderia sp. MM6662-R1 TaxID=2991066 RepID=UPI003D1C2F24